MREEEHKLDSPIHEHMLRPYCLSHREVEAPVAQASHPTECSVPLKPTQLILQFQVNSHFVCALLNHSQYKSFSFFKKSNNYNIENGISFQFIFIE